MWNVKFPKGNQANNFSGKFICKGQIFLSCIVGRNKGKFHGYFGSFKPQRCMRVNKNTLNKYLDKLPNAELLLFFFVILYMWILL